MQSARAYSQKIYFFLGLRVSLVIAISLLVIAFIVTKTAIQAHSESDVEYRQESVFEEIADTNKVQDSPDINPNPIGIDDITPNTVIAMSYEVDKITPTPTPHIDPSSNDIWLKLADCESHQNWSADTGNGYYGGLQFSMGAWASVGGSGKPSEASSQEQIEKAKLLQAKRGWGAWGACASRLGLR